MRRMRFQKDAKNENNESNEHEITLEEIHEVQDNELNKFKNNSDYFFHKSYDIILYCANSTYYTLKFIIRVSGIYLLWICLHYVASHLYIKLCVPNTIVGFLMSPFMTATPHCQGLRWIVYNAANMINNMWLILGAWICSTILIVTKENAHDNRG